MENTIVGQILQQMKTLQLKGTRPQVLIIDIARFGLLQKETNCIDKVFGLEIKIRDWTHDDKSLADCQRRAFFD